MIAETPLERLGAAVNAIPTPIFDTMFACLNARALMVGVERGVIEALEGAPRTAAAVARICTLPETGAERLLNALVASGYLTTRGRSYALAPRARRWLLESSPDNVRDMVLYNFDQWSLFEGIDRYVATGQGVDFHGQLQPDGWGRYQAAMRAATKTWTEQTAKSLPAPRNPRRLLDLGGSHGAFSAALCRLYPTLTGTILELSEAIVAAAPLLAREALGDRLAHKAGDALTEDLGEAQYDIVLISQLAHHFTDAQNRAVAARVGRALRPGGVFAILEQVAVDGVGEARRADRRMGAILDLYFGATSESGTWTVKQMRGWLKAAGLRPRSTIWMRSIPGVALVAGTKP